MAFFDISGRVALVTGGAQGIGFSVSERLAAAGAAVAVVDVNGKGAKEAAEVLKRSGARAEAFACDVSDVDAVERMFGEVLKAYGQVDILVNNAGVGGLFVPIQEQSTEEWHRVIETDLSGVFYCCRAAIPHMTGRRYGRIVNVSSSAGKDGSPLMVPYSSAKAGVIALTKALAKEVAQYNVLVNVITPAIIETPLLFNEMPVERRRLLIERTPVGRFGKPEEVAAMVHFLVSDEATFSTGAVFDLSGGRAVY